MRGLSNHALALREIGDRDPWPRNPLAPPPPASASPTARQAFLLTTDYWLLITLPTGKPPPPSHIGDNADTRLGIATINHLNRCKRVSNPAPLPEVPQRTGLVNHNPAGSVGRWTLLFLLFVSALYTAHVVQWSIRFGRLAMDPGYDDVGYMIDGLNRLDIFQKAGIRGLCDSLFQGPPHSPYSTVAAMVAFDLFGVHDWAPYLLNGVTLFIFLLLAAHLIQLPPGLTKSAIVLSLLMLQLPFQSILQFRPDFPLAVFTAACVTLLLKEGFEPSRSQHELYRYFGIGLLGGVALLVKPPFFPITLLLIFGALGLVEAIRLVLNRSSRNLRSSLIRSFVFFAGVALLAGPFFGLYWRDVIGYIGTNTGTGSDAAIWKVSGGFLSSFAYRVRGYPVYLTMGGLAGLLTLWLVIGLISQAFARRWRSLLFAASILLFSGISLLFVSIVGMTDPNFSFGWEVLFALAAAVSIGGLAKLPYGRWAVALYFAMMAFTYYKVGPPRQVWTLFADAAKGQSLNQAVLQAISEQVPPDQPPKRVFLTFVGGINEASQSWLALTEHLPLQVEDLQRAPDPEQILKKADTADFVEVADPNSAWFAAWIPSNRNQALFLIRMRENQNFEEVRSFIGKEGTVYLFRRRNGQIARP